MFLRDILSICCFSLYIKHFGGCLLMKGTVTFMQGLDS